MAQTWSNLLFAHWRVPADALRQRVPSGLELDTYDGDAWIGVVPFELAIRPRFCPTVPRIAAFPEINVRTYVTLGGKPGVWFFSLDAASSIAVRAARWGFNLPYFHAAMASTRSADAVDYRSVRVGAEPPAAFRAVYGPTSPPWSAEPGSLDAWLTERYCLYAADRRGSLSRTEVHHARWPLRSATCSIEENTMVDPLGLDLVGAPRLHFVDRIAVVNWAPERVRVAAGLPPTPP